MTKRIKVLDADGEPPWTSFEPPRVRADALAHAKYALFWLMERRQNRGNVIVCRCPVELDANGFADWDPTHLVTVSRNEKRGMVTVSLKCNRGHRPSEILSAVARQLRPKEEGD